MKGNIVAACCGTYVYYQFKVRNRIAKATEG
jgi:hypothetical protein